MNTELNAFDILHELATRLETSEDAGAVMHHGLVLLARYMDIKRGAIVIVDPLDGTFRIGASYGLKSHEVKRAEYHAGKGITGKVIESGEAVVLEDASKNPHFLNLTGSRDFSREALSFICVPIRMGGEIVGALWTDQEMSDCQTLAFRLRVMRVFASMLAPAACEGRMIFIKKRERDALPGFVGCSESMRQVYNQILQVAPSQATVFLRGESGTGKELAASSIHALSGRKGSFITVNCAALPEYLVESELFGHERGAFTGATQMRRGRFELAEGGTLFLDEIGELSFMVQAKLLRVLQDRSFERVGGMRTLHVDVRLIAATNRNLEEMVENKFFRRDLFYRLNVFPVFLPPLRDRKEDIPALTNHFLRIEASRQKRKVPVISMTAMDLLQDYAWPGNIRELQNVIERAMLLLQNGSVLSPEHLPGNLASAKSECGPVENLPFKLAAFEKRDIETAMRNNEGHIGKAAKSLGITERVLSLRLRRYGLNYLDFRKKRDK